MIRILYLGQKPIGERCFHVLLESDYSNLRVTGVVTNASAKVWWSTNDIYSLCNKRGIPVIDNAKRHESDIMQLIRKYKINALLSVQHNWILPDEMLKLVGEHAYNLHLAKLPNYSGYNAFNHALLNDDKVYSVTLHRMVSKVDAGDVAFEETFPIDPDETAYSLYTKANEAGVKLFGALIKALGEGVTLPRQAITGEGRFYARDALNLHREIKDVSNIEDVTRKARAFYFPPFEPAYFTVLGRKYYVTPNCGAF